MDAARATLRLGLAGAFAEGTDFLRPGGFCRDDVLFHVAHAAADTLHLDDYEVREIENADWPLSYPVEQEGGQLVMTVRSDDVGGPLEESAAQAILARVNEIGSELVVEGALSMLLPLERAVILPAPTLAGHFQLAEDHPLSGVAFFSVVDALALLDKLVSVDPNGAEGVLGFLQLCREQRLALSWRRG